MRGATCFVWLALAGFAAGLKGADFNEKFHQYLQEAFLLNETYFEWEGYDGWYNNPAHPDWGGAGNNYSLW